MPNAVSSRRRLFVAVDLDDRSRRRLAAIIDDVAHRSEQAGARVRWTPAANLHITLRFIGATPEPDVDRIAAALEPPLAARPFDIMLAGLGTFPGSGPPRVIWAGIARGAEILGRLYDEVEERLQAAGCATEERPFRAHLTLGRVRTGPPRAANAVRRASGDVALEVGPITVDHVTLYESRPSSTGSTYHQLLRTCFGKPA